MKIGAIILTKTGNRELYDMTQQCITTLEKACDIAEVECHIVVMESNPEAASLGYVYKGKHRLETRVPDESFNFNRFYNLGMAGLNADLYLFLNNDLIFQDHSIHRAIAAFKENPDILSATPIDPNFEGHKKYLGQVNPMPGYKVRNHLCGWAIFAKAEVFEKIGPWDEKFLFWYQDNDYASTLEKHGIKHALFPSSIVFHLESKSHKEIPRGKAKDFKENMKKVYDNKWKQQLQNFESPATLF